VKHEWVTNKWYNIYKEVGHFSETDVITAAQYIREKPDIRCGLS